MAVSTGATRAVDHPGAVAADHGQAAVPRKRRRRAPTTGATEDCFACRKRQTKCDRRRPYCGQCIELGKECSGYRTTLTWGVGVASRGKLRGMSLPIAKSPQTTTAASRTQASSSAGNTSCTQATKTVSTKARPAGPHLSSNPNVSHGQSSFEVTNYNATSPIPIPAPLPNLPWHVPGFSEHAEGYHLMSGKPTRQRLHSRPLQRLHTSFTSPYEEHGFSASTGSLSGFSDGDYSSPSDYPHTPDDFTFFEPSLPCYHNYYLHEVVPLNSTEHPGHRGSPRSYPTVTDDMCSSISSDQSTQDLSEVHSVRSSSFGHASIVEGSYGADMSTTTTPLQYATYSYCQQLGDLPEEHVPSDLAVLSPDVTSQMCPSMPRSVYTSTSVHLSPRMSYLLDYYDKFICPVLVAFDGPSNPYRMHVLHLAMHNEGLQNAIAALATNNLRMRGGTEHRPLAFEQGAQSEVTAEELRELQGKPSPEEQRYKAASIRMLNEQLANPQQAKDDSVLATLLILCLFHVCDSGFSKFKTQLAGVQKLLGMRDRRVPSDFLGWIEVFFTWFDVMTSTVNDRETQVRGDSLDMPNLSANLGALEHLAGCEGRLFKLIARLGRLNLLSQNRPVRERNHTTLRPDPLPKSGSYHGFRSPHERFRSGETSPVLSPPSPSPHDPRTEFWTEWHDLHTRLQKWDYDPSTSPVPPYPHDNPHDTTTITNTATATTDLYHISSAFRAAALLYLARLAAPPGPPRPLGPSDRHLASIALGHIAAIPVHSPVNKFLLWPLFIAGAEAEAGTGTDSTTHRDQVRRRCLAIQRESGFWNNLSVLEVLERVWRDEDDDKGGGGEPGAWGRNRQAGTQDDRTDWTGQPFPWRKAMLRHVEGEYIII